MTVNLISPIRCAAFLAIGLATTLAVTSCQPVVRSRTLPPSVRAVYIPMIDNRTAEFGLEEELTIAIQEEILADGRLDLVREKDADAVVPITIRQFGTSPAALDSDGFGTTQQWDIEADFEIIENIPGRPRIGERRDVELSYLYNDDTRSIGFNGDPFEKRQMARLFAQTFVLELLTGELEETIPTLVELQSTKDERDRPNSRLDLP